MTPSRRRRALITGAGSGIGRAVALDLIKQGWSVCLLGRRVEPLEHVALRAPLSGGEAHVITCDLADRAATDVALEQVTDTWDALDGLVLNAGISEVTALDAPDTRGFDEHLEVNLTAPFRLVRGLLPMMGDGSRIVSVASVLARFGVPLMHGYCTSKAGLVGFTRALAQDLAPRGITVNAVLPAWVDTAMAERAIEAQAPSMGFSPEEARKFFEEDMPIGRFLNPEEVSALVTFLLGSRSSGITGQALNVCGGSLA